MSAAPADLLGPLLAAVSRSFYTTLRVLPKPVRPQIGLAYLLARASDTIADTDIVAAETRLAVLDQFRARVLGSHRTPLSLDQLVSGGSSPSERTLLERIEEAFALLDQFAPEDQGLIREVLDIIISGQALDVSRFGSASAERIVALDTDPELEDYIYRVAGCVGEFWTRLCRARLFPRHPLDETRFLADARAFGKGLQLVNVLRDVGGDLRQGRCYVPQALLAPAQLNPKDLLDHGAMVRFRPLYDRLLDRADAYLRSGWNYTNAIPYAQFRVRWACAWPILIGRATLAELRHRNPLDVGHRITVDRSTVRSIVFRSIVTSPFPGLWRRLGCL